MARRVAERADDLVLYLYAVTKSGAGDPPPVRGVDGQARIEAISSAGLTCWISRVPSSEFGESFSKRLEDLDWLAAVSVRHQRAVAAIAESRDTLPARLGTVFLSDASLEADIRKRKAALDADLRRIAGTQEWGIKVFVSPQPAVLPAKVRTGKEYLQAKSSLLRSRKPPGLSEEVKKFAHELERLAVATAEGGKISGGTPYLHYQASILLKRTDRPKLEKLLRRFSRQWKDTHKIECSGPWPPYSFVSRSAKSK
jgi:hypothetical protein